MLCPYLLISINELLISIISFNDINKYGLNVKTAAYTHVRIETRLALTKNKLTNPTPEGFRGVFIACRAVRPSVVRSFAPVVCVR